MGFSNRVRFHPLRFPRAWARTAAAVFLLSLLLAPAGLRAGDHVVSPAELHQSLLEAKLERDASRNEVVKFFSSPRVRDVLAKARIDSKKVEEAVASLSDDELQRLAAQSREARREVVAGALNNQQLTYIVIALATAIVVILAT